MEPENQQVSENEQVAIRKEKLTKLKKATDIPYPNNFCRTHWSADLHQSHDHLEANTFEKNPIEVSVAGRMVMRRIMGRASFTHIQDMKGKIQLYIKQDDHAALYEAFKNWDIGDIVGCRGTLFKTRTGELTVRVKDICLLVKSLRPLPDKFHGLVDHELRYRQRYLDVLTNEETRRTFEIRSKLIDAIRDFLKMREFLEVETPMMQTIPGGAIARPFVTHHNALDLTLYLRIAPELYLKRLVVGGVERVFEINRNFRNEGLSTRHNPEFTMVEFYQAYATYTDLMLLTETLLRELALKVLGTLTVTYQNKSIDLSPPFKKMTLKEAVLQFNSTLTPADLISTSKLLSLLKNTEREITGNESVGKLLTELFEATVEDHLQQPTFITGYPIEVSPLARPNDQDETLVDRFELFMGGREIANGFSELNDPELQAEHLRSQAAEKAVGNEEAMFYDADYVKALEYGLPPTAGEGIGIDRLIMLFTNQPSIRDVILFPLMRPESCPC